MNNRKWLESHGFIVVTDGKYASFFRFPDGEAHVMTLAGLEALIQGIRESLAVPPLQEVPNA
jgi:hypothetical protein